MSEQGARAGAEYEAVLRLVNERTGLTFGSSLRQGLEARIRRAMAQRAHSDPARYLAMLTSDLPTFDALVAELTVGETYFLRESAQFDYIRSEVIPSLRRQRAPGSPLRAWSAGCASGEEAYSLAILLHELGLGESAIVVGTDISYDRLARAREANYSRWSLRGVPDRIIRTYFERSGNRYRLVPELRTLVTFRRLNLAESCYPSLASGIRDMDLILCRNVMIYLDPDTVVQVAHRLISSLSPDGWLFLGASDPLLSDLVPCEVVVTGAGVAYRRSQPGARSVDLPPPVPALPAGSPGVAWPKVAEEPEPPTPVGVSAAPASAEGDVAARYASGEYARAAELAAQLVARDGGSPALCALWVRALANQGKLAEAGQACSTALEHHGTDAELMYLHALLLSTADHQQEAVAAARRALFLDRELIVAHLLLGRVLLRRGDRQGAGRALRNAERLLLALPPDASVPASDGELAGRLLNGARLQMKLLGQSA